MKVYALAPQCDNNLYGTLRCTYCGHVQDIVLGYNDNHWYRKVLPATHCDNCLRNEKGLYPTEGQRQRNQARRITNIPTQAQIDEHARRCNS